VLRKKPTAKSPRMSKSKSEHEQREGKRGDEILFVYWGIKGSRIVNDRKKTGGGDTV